IEIRAALRFVTTSLSDARVGTSYSAQISAADGLGPYTFSLASGQLPTGLSLSATGGISGTATAAGTATVSIRVTDQTETAVTQAFTIRVVASPTAPAISTASLPDGTVGAPYSSPMAGQGAAPMTWSVSAGALPGGLSLNRTTGAITGTPSASGTFQFTIALADSNALTGTRAFTIRVQLPVLSAVNITQLG